jgi:hypothetical protein
MGTNDTATISQLQKWKEMARTEKDVLNGRAQSELRNTSTTDFTDFRDKKYAFPIREIREIRGKKSSRK